MRYAYLLSILLIMTVVYYKYIGIKTMIVQVEPKVEKKILNQKEEVVVTKKEIIQKQPVKKRKILWSAKKKRFYNIMIPAVNRVHNELQREYEEILNDIKNGTNRQKIQRLKKIYRAKSDEDLLMRMKPHPKSITLAQAALESAWGTSKFFLKGNNVFGIHATSENQPRIEAGLKKGVWVRKFKTVDDSIKAYYMLLSRGTKYEAFRKAQAVSNDPFVLIKKLDKYSGIGEQYSIALSKVIRHNDLTRYDD